MQIKPKKSLGQHFLKDENILSKIASSVLAGKEDRIIEIGPGEGALTNHLLKHSDDVTVVEIDQRAVELLEHKFPGLDIVQKDILKADWETLKTENKRHFICGNIPYYITSPILFKVMDSGNWYKRAVFLMQKEVAERLVASPGSKTYGILSVQAQIFGKTELLFTVSRHAFFPKPNVESAVISFEPYAQNLPVDIANFKQVVRMAFNQRRKKLSNSLSPLLAGREIESIDLNLRPEQLEPKDFVTLTEELFSENS